MEWSFEAERIQELRQLSKRSGGTERFDLASVWNAPRAVNYRTIRGWLLAAFLVMVLVDAALTQLDVWLIPSRATTRRGKNKPERP